MSVMQAYTENQRSLLACIQAGRYGTPECDAMFSHAAILWGQLTPEEQATIEGGILTDLEFNGHYEDREMPLNIAWEPANAPAATVA